jgi:hypothetical protein
MIDDSEEVLFVIKLTDFVNLVREYAEHLDHIGSEMTATEALSFFADSLDMADVQVH